MKAYKIFIASIVLTLCACEDKHEYEAGAPDAQDCMGVYFDADNENDFILIPGEDTTIDIKMHRLNATSAADVPIIGQSSVDGIEFPATVHFDAGSADASLEINCAGLPVKQPVRFSVNVPDEYINHYSATLYNYEASAIVSQWESANTDGSPVVFYFTSVDCNQYNSFTSKIESAAFQPVESRMEILPGAGLIKIYDFLNTGADMIFQLTPSPYSDFEGKYRVSPKVHYYSLAEAYESDAYGDEWYNAWFITAEDEEGEEDYAEAILTDLDGNEASVDYPYIFWYSEAYTFEYAYANLKSDTRNFNSISMGFAGTTSVTLPSTFYIYFRWDGESGI